MTLDPDVERLVNDEVHRSGRPFKQVVNDAIRRGLSSRLVNAPQRPYRTVVHKAKLRAGIVPGSLNRLTHELEDEAMIGKLGKTDPAGKTGNSPRR